MPATTKRPDPRHPIHDQGRLLTVPVETLAPGMGHQPRRHIERAPLEELAESIRAQGVIQPIVARRLSPPHATALYEIIAGERRWRAAQLAGLHEVPVQLIEAGDEQTGIIALVENIQREDLNPLETADAVARILDQTGLTQRAVAQMLGLSRDQVAHLVRLLKLGAVARRLVSEGLLDMGHAKVLAGLPPEVQDPLARAAADGRWTVRRLEREASRARQPSPEHPRRRDPNIVRLEQQVGETVCAATRIDYTTDGTGQLRFSFHSLDELEGILNRLGIDPSSR